MQQQQGIQGNPRQTSFVEYPQRTSLRENNGQNVSPRFRHQISPSKIYMEPRNNDPQFSNFNNHNVRSNIKQIYHPPQQQIPQNNEQVVRRIITTQKQNEFSPVTFEQMMVHNSHLKALNYQLEQSKQSLELEKNQLIKTHENNNRIIQCLQKELINYRKLGEERNKLVEINEAQEKEIIQLREKISKNSEQSEKSFVQDLLPCEPTIQDLKDTIQKLTKQKDLLIQWRANSETDNDKIIKGLTKQRDQLIQWRVNCQNQSDILIKNLTKERDELIQWRVNIENYYIDQFQKKIETFATE